MQDKLLSLSLNGTPIEAPGNIPTTGLGANGAGSQLISHVIQWGIIIAAVLSLFAMLYSGIQWIMSGGDKNKMQAARNRLTYAVIGLLVSLLAIFIVNVLGHLLGVSFFSQS